MKRKGCGVFCAVLATILVAIVIIIIVVASQVILGGDSNSQELLKKKEVSISETVKVDDFECSIKELNWYSASDFDYDLVEREEGYEYIVIVLSEKNISDNAENAPMSNLLSADGKDCLNVVTLSLYKNKYKINFGATMPNSVAESYVIYKIPAGSNTFKLQILSNGFGSGSDYIVFERTDIK